ncbi:ABC transporter ATP-binding protein [Dysgonomonas sp. 25]|uniref:ABC transporter ATP-binding protein n=1 Tax=Dysgonomonas sp. 25 TaxID=2302933 RepID=UPI0013D6B396|nr:ABC transporter ATP-binding protein [Dysgonomonas sp. 25]NDV69043.1 ABC transporter ATP-binding protein [Dysgonomonas sp. 25]
MSDIAIKFEGVSKQYRLGVIGTGTISHDLNRWWHLVRGKEDPYLKIGETNDRSAKATSEYVWALRDISFDVKQGDVIGIIGKNGAGKSTLLKLLSRVTSPTLGSIKAKGRIASLLEVGTGFHPEMTGRENIYMNGAIMGMTKAEITQKLDEIVAFAGVEKYIDTPVKRYSSGMTVRLGFAIAAHLEPEILVVDEVLAVGDAEFQKKAIGKMQDVSQKGGRTVLFVSHNMGAVETLCTKGIVLKDGQLSFQGSVKDSIDEYLKDETFSEERIINGIEYLSNNIIINNISINDSESNVVCIDENNSDIHIVIEGENISEKNMSLGLVLYDYRKVRLGIFSPGHVKASNSKFEKGKFRIEETLHLPSNMTKGEFYLGISLHQPNIELFMNIPYFVQIISKGKTGATGLEFEYKDNGFLIL